MAPNQNSSPERGRARHPSRLASHLLLAGAAIVLLGTCGDVNSGDGGTGPVKPASLAILPDSAAVNLAASLTLTSVVRNAKGDTLAGATVHWTSLDPGIASVDQDGKVIGEGAGTTSIVASVGAVGDTARVTVIRLVTAITLSPAGGATIAVGASQAVTAVARDAKGVVFAGVPIAWSSSDSQAVTVSSTGLTQAVAAGAAGITASSGSVHAAVLIRVVGISPAKPSRHGEALWAGPSPNRWSELYGPAAVWPSVQARTHVVKLYIDDIYAASPAALQQVIQSLNAAHIAVAVELGGLRDWDCSGAHLAQTELTGLLRFGSAGGAISFLAMDSPFGHTLATSIPGNCGFSAQQVADQLVLYIHRMRQALPWVSIGLIEPVPWYSVGAYAPNPGNNFGDLPKVLDTLLTTLAQHGEHLDFFHADSPYDYNQAHGQGWDKLLALQRTVRSSGLRFGVIYNSDAGGQAGDQPFHDQTLAALQAFKDTGGNPDDFLVQSWYPYPSVMVPESQLYTFTNVEKDFEALYDVLYP